MSAEMCAIAAWKHHCGLVVMDVWLKARGEPALSLTRELYERHYNSITVDTLRDGVFRIEKHGREFEQWCRT